MATDPDDTVPFTTDSLGAVDAATRGLDAVLGREVAMVTLPPMQGEDLVVRTEQVRRLAGLHHAHLVEVFDVDGLAEGAESTLVLQSVDGRPLDPAFDRARWAPIAVAEVGAQLASGLAHAHARGVVHGRIGPASVVLGGTVGAPFAWLTGFTAALRPVPPGGVGTARPDPARPHPAGDVADLGRTLGVVLDPGAPAAPALELVLGEMAAGTVAARTAAETLARVAEALRHADQEKGLVPLVVASPAVPAAPARPVSAPRRAPDHRDAGPARARSGRRARRAGRGVQLAALGGAALTVAMASGLVLYTTEDFGTPREVGVSDQAPATRTGGSPVAVGPPVSSGPGRSETSRDGDDSDGSDDDDSDGEGDTDVRATTSRSTSPSPATSPITSDVTTLPPPVVPTVPPTTVPPTTFPTTGPTSTPTTTTTTPVAPRDAGTDPVTLAAP